MQKVEAPQSIKRYLDVLIQHYPEPLSQTELAIACLVTKSAISRVREELVRFCDVNTLVYHRKLVLSKSDKVFSELSGFYFLCLDFSFLGSSYAKTIFDEKPIHETISKGFKELNYDHYFTKEDTNWLVSIVLHNFSNFKWDDTLLTRVKRLGDKDNNASIETAMPIVLAINKMMNSFDWYIFQDKSTLTRTLTLQTKFYRFSAVAIPFLLNQWEYIQQIQDKTKRKQTVEVLSDAIRFLLKKQLQTMTENAKTKAQEKGIQFPTENHILDNT